jgi:hypothetical protein
MTTNNNNNIYNKHTVGLKLKFLAMQNPTCQTKLHDDLEFSATA